MITAEYILDRLNDIPGSRISHIYRHAVSLGLVRDTGRVKVPVYRVEDARRQGPHQTDDRADSDIGYDLCAWYSTDRQPVPWRDGIDIVGHGNYHHGFESMSKLWDWFYDDAMIELLTAHEYGVAVYKTSVAHVHYGHRQMIFLRGRADRVSWTPFSDLLTQGIIAA